MGNAGLGDASCCQSVNVINFFKKRIDKFCIIVYNYAKLKSKGEGAMNNTFTNRPVTMNESKNLLEIEEHMYILDDVKKPNVFRNMFPYS